MNVASDVSDGLCNSFDTAIAIEDIGNYADTDTDSGVHNNSTPDHLDTLETRTNDSLYESLKYQQGEFAWCRARLWQSWRDLNPSSLNPDKQQQQQVGTE